MYRFLGVHYARWSWLLWPLRYLMRIVVRPEGFNAEALKEKSHGKHIVYILPRMFLIDAFILNIVLQKLRVPRARYEANPSSPRVASLLAVKPKRGFINQDKTDAFSAVVKHLYEVDKRIGDDNLIFIPVSVFWGREPERSGRNPVVRFLFPEDQNANSLQKVLMLFLWLRVIHIHFGSAINPKEVLNEVSVDEPKRINVAAARVRRALLVDFNREKSAALGPALYEVDDAAKWILKSKETQKFLGDSTAESAEKSKRKIVHFLKEIAANYNATTIRAFEVSFDFVWTRIFKGVRVRNFDRASLAAKEGQILWMPCHRSHLDYLLLSYVLVKKGFVAPHIVAGANLSFWPAGPIFRRGGAFFIRRSISGNRLYSHTLSQYVHFLLHNGFPIEFFHEGGRSRIGKTLTPKTGFLSWCVSSILKRKAENTYIVPVYFGYDKVIEDDSYARELSGAKKQKESLWKLIKSVRYLFSNYGRVDVAFGEPIHIGKEWENYFADNANSADIHSQNLPIAQKIIDVPEDIDTRDMRVQKFVRHVSVKVNERINSTATASGTALLTSSLLAQSETWISKDRLQRRVTLLHWIINKLRASLPWEVATSLAADTSDDFLLARLKAESKGEVTAVVPVKTEGNLDRNLEELFSDAVKWNLLTLKPSEPGKLYKNPNKEMNLWWYRGTIFHLLALPGLVASFLLEGRNKGGFQFSQLASRLFVMREIWQDELYWPQEIKVKDFLEATLNVFQELGLIVISDEKIALVETEMANETLKFLSEIIRPEREIYSLQLCAAETLLEIKGEFSKDELIRTAIATHRTAFLRGVASQPAIHSKFFGNRTFDALLKSGVFVLQGKSSFNMFTGDIQPALDFFDVRFWREFANQL